MSSRSGLSTRASTGARASGTTARLAALAGPMMVAIAFQSLANLALHAALGRSLSPGDYGALGSVLAAMTLVAVPLTALQTAAARTSAARGISGATGRRALADSVRLLAPVCLLLLALAAPIADFLHLARWWDAALLAPTMLIAGLLASARGLLLGAGRTAVVSATYLLSSAIRLGLGIHLGAALGVIGALIATVLGEVAALALALRPVWPTSPGATQRSSFADLTRTTLVVTGLFAFTTVDLFLARHFLAGEESGAYVAAATIGKTILALPAAAMAVAFPRLVAAWATGSGRAGALQASLVVVATPALAGALLVAAAPQLVLTLLYGDSFTGTEQLTRALVCVAGASAVVSVLAHAAMARGSRAALVPWLATGGQVVGVGLWHSSALVIAAVSAACLLMAVAALALTEARAWSPRAVPIR